MITWQQIFCKQHYIVEKGKKKQVPCSFGLTTTDKEYFSQPSEQDERLEVFAVSKKVLYLLLEYILNI